MAIELSNNGAFVLNILPALEDEGTPYSYSMSAYPELSEEDNLDFASPVDIQLSFLYTKGRVVLNGRLKAKLSVPCDRCLAPVETPLEMNLAEVLYRNASDDEDDEYLYSGEKVALDKIIIDNIYLSKPDKTLCKEDCKGLCPICGVNLNEQTCSCEAEEKEQEAEISAENPFAKLAGLFTDEEV